MVKGEKDTNPEYNAFEALAKKLMKVPSKEVKEQDSKDKQKSRAN